LPLTRQPFTRATRDLKLGAGCHISARDELSADRADAYARRKCADFPQHLLFPNVFAVIATIALFAYLLGSIPFGLLVARSHGIDIRQHGSGNIGATNVWRVLGKKWGIITFAADLLKGLLAVIIGQWIATHWAIHVPLPRGHVRIDHFDPGFAGIAAALGCVLGHSFPLWLGFKGGKGVATSLGVILGMMPLAALVAFALWAVVFKLSHYVSLASVIAAVALPVIVMALLFLGWLHGWAHFHFAVAAGGLVVLRHRTNLRRLVEGTEHRFGAPSPPAASVYPPPPLDP
jgi:acyl phosphate:glycerol-3-phosphate acyltransferase